MAQDSDSSGSEESEEEEDGGRAPTDGGSAPTDAGEWVRQALFPESGSSEEDSDWIVEDYCCLTSTDSGMPVVSCNSIPMSLRVEFLE